MPRHARSLLPGALLALLLLVPSGCDRDFPSSEGRAPIDRATFVDTFVELRLAAVRSGRVDLPAEERERVLREQGVSEGELRAFIEVHGRNVPYMNELWREVEQRFEAARSPDELRPDPGPQPEFEVRTPGS